MERVPITFKHKETAYAGYLAPVHGAGQQTWQLISNGYFLGNLRYCNGWVFDSAKMPEMTDYFGDYLTAWYQ